MNVTYEKKEAFTLIGYHTQIRHEEGYQKCPEFWTTEYSEKYARLWQTMRPETPVEKALLENNIGTFAICADAEDSFTYWIAGMYQGGEVPEGLELCTFPAGEWAVFISKGPIPGALQNLNTAIWQEWFPTEGQRVHANGSITLEVYSPGDTQSPDYECYIWMPVGKTE